jgi:hypothetical protein
MKAVVGCALLVSAAKN